MKQYEMKPTYDNLFKTLRVIQLLEIMIYSALLNCLITLMAVIPLHSMGIGVAARC